MAAKNTTGWYRRGGKRCLDALAAAGMLLLLSPLLASLAVLIRFRLGSPVLFRQDRPGLQGRVFSIYKFRTMTDARDAAGNLLPDDIRLTKFGRWLRSTSLDELPELWNILIGDMSFVGPRPLLVRYLPLYTPEQSRRHDVRPGLSGWAQIHGRNATTWEERLAHDVWYVDHLTLPLDVSIAWATVGKVLKRDGVSHGETATMPEFTGTSVPAVPQRRAA
ncbi:sugar transferase [bacterium]|nr:sugar transferase [bacterium]